EPAAVRRARRFPGRAGGHEQALLVPSILHDRGRDGRPDASSPDLPQGDGVARLPGHHPTRVANASSAVSDHSRARARIAPTSERMRAARVSSLIPGRLISTLAIAQPTAARSSWTAE